MFCTHISNSYIMIAMSDRKKSIKILMSERKEKFGIKLTKLFLSKCKKKLALCDKGLYYNQGKWTKEHDSGNVQYYNEYYDDDFDLRWLAWLIENCFFYGLILL